MTDAHGCILCASDLAPTELLTCRPCVSEVRQALTRIEALFAVLPSLLGRPDGASLDSVMGGRSDEAALPGGDVLAMLAPGAGCGEGHPSDPPAVAFELAQWCEDWAQVRGESEWPSSVPGCVSWLGARLEWASSYHLAFDDFAADLSRIRARLQAVTGTFDAPETGAPCIYCQAVNLERRFGPGRRCSHTRADWRLGLVPLPPGVQGPLRLETVIDRDLRIEAWEAEHALCDAGGLDDDWSCPRCRRVFDEVHYRLALRMMLESATERVGA